MTKLISLKGLVISEGFLGFLGFFFFVRGGGGGGGRSLLRCFAHIIMDFFLLNVLSLN